MNNLPKDPIGHLGQDLEKQVADLYDFSLEIARHEDDIAFKGSIHYVFDENIFELFIQAFDNYPFVMRDQEAQKVELGKHPSERHLIAMQSALFTAETLFGFQLPGQKSPNIYITEWHRWELLSRVKVLIAELSGGTPGERKEAADRVLKVKQELLSAEISANEFPTADSQLNADLSHFDQRIEAGRGAAQRFAKVRRAAAVLSQDRHLEPLQQLRRVLRLDADGTLVDLKELIPLDPRGLIEIEKSAREWETALDRELTARAVRYQTAQKKSRGAVRNDARSLALVDWVSRQLDPLEERIVFVTGDPSLFDTYRRVFGKNNERGRSPSEPFLVRRPLQYSTLFSAKTNPDISLQERLFYSLQQIVELPLTPIRLGAVANRRSSLDILYRRQSLTLYRYDEVPPQPSFFHEIWISHHSAYSESQISRVEDQIDLNERILNGLSYHLLEARVTEEERQLFEQVSKEEPSGREELFAAYVDRAVEDMIRSAVAMWQPEAERYFKRAMLRGVRRDKRRIPLAMHGGPGDASRKMRVFELLDEILNPEDSRLGKARSRKSLRYLSSSFEIFIGAAAVALYANQWRLGDHFCEVAINAFKYFSNHEGTTENEAAEVHYLSALAKRFRLGQIMVREDRAGYLAGQKLFSEATVLLRSSQELASGQAKAFVCYRSYSERGALCLFYACLCKAQADQLQGVEGTSEISQSAVAAFVEAANCLLEAIRVGQSAGFGLVPPDIVGSHVALVKSQILINTATWYSVAPVILGGQTSLDRYRELAKECSRNLELLEGSLPQAGGISFAAEILAFKISQGINVSANRLALEKILAQSESLSLEIDKTLLKMIETRWAD